VAQALTGPPSWKTRQAAHLHGFAYSPKSRLAFARIRAAWAGLNFPLRSISVARPLALTSGEGSLLRVADFSFAIAGHNLLGARAGCRLHFLAGAD
jgi:hypothetical protein